MTRPPPTYTLFPYTTLFRSSQTGKQGDGRVGTPQNARHSGGLGDRDGAGRADRRGTTAAESATFAGSESRISRGPHPVDGSAAGRAALFASQQAFAAGLDPHSGKAIHPIRANRRADPRVAGRERGGRNR